MANSILSRKCHQLGLPENVSKLTSDSADDTYITNKNSSHAQQLRHKTGRKNNKKTAEGQSRPFSQRVNGQEKIPQSTHCTKNLLQVNILLHNLDHICTNYIIL